MATTVINGVNYEIPPGTEHVWTPPEEVKVTFPRDDVPVINAVHGLRVHGLVRNQTEQKVIDLSDKLEKIWQDFLDNKATKELLITNVANFRNNDLQNAEGIDEITVQAFETVIIKMLTESNQ